MRPLTHVHRTMLTALVRDGNGSGQIDPAGRVCVGPIRTPIHGDAVAWLVLMSHGLVAGERGFVIATEAGREMAGAGAEGRVRTSPGQ